MNYCIVTNLGYFSFDIKCFYIVGSLQKSGLLWHRGQCIGFFNNVRPGLLVQFMLLQFPPNHYIWNYMWLDGCLFFQYGAQTSEHCLWGTCNMALTGYFLHCIFFGAQSSVLCAKHIVLAYEGRTQMAYIWSSLELERPVV